MLTFLIKRVLAWLAGITPDQWEAALLAVRRAETDFTNSDNKRAWVYAQLKSLYPALTERALNLLLELAVAHFKR